MEFTCCTSSGGNRYSSITPMVSPAGANGPLQFMPCTWVGWSHPSCGGLGKGIISDSEKTDPAIISKYGGYGVDAMGTVSGSMGYRRCHLSTAKYFAANGAAEGHLRDAVFAYNHADWYVEEVLGFADRYVNGYVAVNTRWWSQHRCCSRGCRI